MEVTRSCPLLPHPPWLEIVRHLRRAGRQAHQQIHLRFQHYVVAGFAFGGQNAYLAGSAVHGDVHENIKADRNGVGANAVLLQGGAQVAEAASVRLRVPVDNAKRIGATRRRCRTTTPSSRLGIRSQRSAKHLAC